MQDTKDKKQTGKKAYQTRGNSRPVSYTHLDVYKRQMVESLSTTMIPDGDMAIKSIQKKILSNVLMILLQPSRKSHIAAASVTPRSAMCSRRSMD